MALYIVLLSRALQLLGLLVITTVTEVFNPLKLFVCVLYMFVCTCVCMHA